MARVGVGEAKGRPQLTWVGKRPLRSIPALPAQEMERFMVDGAASTVVDWSAWPSTYGQGGLLFHGDNKEVLGHLLANGFRGMVDLVYIDPPFDSSANYVRTVSLRGAKGTAQMAGEGYTLGEQIQYADIWANDTYLQFMYERLLLLRELIAPTGSIYLHCDWRRVQHLRLLMDEVFGPDNLLNEVIWYFPNKIQGNVQRFATNHHNLLWYAKNRDAGQYQFTRIEEERERAIKVNRRYWDAEAGVFATLRDENGNVLYAERSERVVDDVWIVPAVSSAENKQEGYPTQKPDELLERVIVSSSKPGSIVLDCFVGSGTAAVVAQRHGRRWIACDMNRGSIQTTGKRLMDELSSQVEAGSARQTTVAGNEPPMPAQLAFATYRVNDYDLAIQHNEAVELACRALGIQRLKTDGFFDGTLGRQLVRILPFDHPASPIDVEEVISELRNRPTEERDIVIVALGKELACEARLADHNRPGAPNKISLIELRTDPKVAGFFAHEPASADVRIDETDGLVRVRIDDFVSPTILERLRQQDGLVSPQIVDWRAMVDSVMIDPRYDGDVFEVGITDVPERKSDLVAGIYEIAAASVGSRIGVKITDMLGEEVLTVIERRPEG
jgi:DNA modification methylase